MLWLLDLINPESKLFIGLVIILVIAIAIYLLRKLDFVTERKRGGYGDGLPLVMMFAIQPVGLYLFPYIAIQYNISISYIFVGIIGILTIPMVIIKFILVFDPHQNSFLPGVGFIASIYIVLGLIFTPLYWAYFAAENP